MLNPAGKKSLEVAKTLMGLEKCLNCKGKGKTLFMDVRKKCKYCEGKGWLKAGTIEDLTKELDFAEVELKILGGMFGKKLP